MHMRARLAAMSTASNSSAPACRCFCESLRNKRCGEQASPWGGGPSTLVQPLTVCLVSFIGFEVHDILNGQHGWRGNGSAPDRGTKDSVLGKPNPCTYARPAPLGYIRTYLFTVCLLLGYPTPGKGGYAYMESGLHLFVKRHQKELF